MEGELVNAENMAQMFEILGRYYDLENCKPGYIVKRAIIQYLQMGVKTVRAQAKPMHA